MEEEHVEIVVSGHKVKERLDTFLTREIARISRNQIQKLIREGRITVNGQKVKVNHRVLPSEKIEIILPRAVPPDLLPEHIPLDIVYEDRSLLVLNKKAGMVVHPAIGHHRGTLVNALLAHCKELSDVNDPMRPGIVHRIDKDTSGLMVVAKNNYVHSHLAKQFEKKSIKRIYVSLVWGHFKKKSGTIETLLARSIKDRKKISVAATGKNAITHYEVKAILPLTSLLHLRLETGRTHQIRVHLAHIGHPVFGDQVYGGRGRQLGGRNQQEVALANELFQIIDRQALHAMMLGFIHPETGSEMIFKSELPEDMQNLIGRLKDETKKMVR